MDIFRYVLLDYNGVLPDSLRLVTDEVVEKFLLATGPAVHLYFFQSGALNLKV